jgi:hypothetical protein
VNGADQKNLIYGRFRDMLEKKEHGKPRPKSKEHPRPILKKSEGLRAIESVPKIIAVKAEVPNKPVNPSKPLKPVVVEQRKEKLPTPKVVEQKKEKTFSAPETKDTWRKLNNQEKQKQPQRGPPPGLSTTARFHPFSTFPAVASKTISKPIQQLRSKSRTALLLKMISDEKSHSQTKTDSNKGTGSPVNTSKNNRKPPTPSNYRSEYRNSFNLLPTISSTSGRFLSGNVPRRVLRKPPVPSHFVSTRRPMSPRLLAKKPSPSASFYARFTKKPSVSNLPSVLKSNGLLTDSSRRRVSTPKQRRGNNSGAGTTSSSVAGLRKKLPDHLAFGNFNGLKIGGKGKVGGGGAGAIASSTTSRKVGERSENTSKFNSTSLFLRNVAPGHKTDDTANRTPYAQSRFPYSDRK